MNQMYSTYKQVLSLSYTHIHTHTPPARLAHSLLAERTLQRDQCLCLCGGGVRLGETKGAHSSEPTASRPSVPLSRRERQPRNVSQACREMAACSQRLGTLLPDAKHSSSSCLTVALKDHRQGLTLRAFFNYCYKIRLCVTEAVTSCDLFLIIEKAGMATWKCSKANKSTQGDCHSKQLLFSNTMHTSLFNTI